MTIKLIQVFIIFSMVVGLAVLTNCAPSSSKNRPRIRPGTGMLPKASQNLRETPGTTAETKVTWDGLTAAVEGELSARKNVWTVPDGKFEGVIAIDDPFVAALGPIRSDTSNNELGLRFETKGAFARLTFLHSENSRAKDDVVIIELKEGNIKTVKEDAIVGSCLNDKCGISHVARVDQDDPGSTLVNNILNLSFSDEGVSIELERQKIISISEEAIFNEETIVSTYHMNRAHVVSEDSISVGDVLLTNPDAAMAEAPDQDPGTQVTQVVEPPASGEAEQQTDGETQGTIPPEPTAL